MNKISIIRLIFTITVLISLIACGDNDPIIPNEEELITTVNYTLTPDGGGDDVVLSWIDIDGDGSGNIVGGILKANSTYTGTISLLNESETPSENITLEVEEEAEDHQFFFEVESNLNATIDYDDSDANNNPIGIITKLSTGDASIGSIDLILRHQPDKSAANVKAGDKTNAGGSTDIEISLSVVIQ
jgi:hypothetical protein